MDNSSIYHMENLFVYNIYKKCQYAIYTMILSSIPEIDHLSLCHVDKIIFFILHKDKFSISGTEKYNSL